MTGQIRPPAAGTRRYRIIHRTEYRYSDVVTSSYGRGFLTPRDLSRQRCLHHDLRIDPEPADRSTGRDGYGNITTYFHVTAPHRALSVTSASVVEVDPIPPQHYSADPATARPAPSTTT